VLNAARDILEAMHNRSLSVFVFLIVLLYCFQSGKTQSTAEAVTRSEISADLGPCSALIIVTGTDSKPVYAAKINTRIQYGLLGVKKLEVLKKPMYIHISKGEKGEMVEFKPNVRCRATFNVQLR
jgi:hypothetical protein